MLRAVKGKSGRNVVERPQKPRRCNFASTLFSVVLLVVSREKGNILDGEYKPPVSLSLFCCSQPVKPNWTSDLRCFQGGSFVEVVRWYRSANSMPA